jgi:predicted nucleotide-binding protein (sugar kinase/HSP70/actin superfamily)
MRHIKADVDAVKARTPNLVALAARQVFASPHVPPVAARARRRGWLPAGRSRRSARSSVRVGIPRVFNMFAYAPLFTGYLESLGVAASNIVFSGHTTPELYRAGASRGAIDPCFPSKVALAHVHHLLCVAHGRQPLTCIFFPMVDVLPNRLGEGLGSDACPTVALTPQTVRAAFTREADLFAERGVVFLSPLLNLRDRPLFRKQMFEAWGPLLELSRDENARAVDAGFAALEAYDRRVMAAARHALDDLEREGRVGVVLLGRVYHHDPGLNHGIAEDLQTLGYPVFSQSTLPLDADLLDRLFGDEVRAGRLADARNVSDVWRHAYSGSSNLKIWAAKFAARHPWLVAVELSNFKCGHDAPIYSTIEDITERSGTPYFAFKDLDENRPAGALKLRLETIDYALKRHAEALRERQARAARVERVLARYERLVKTRLATVARE